jgi:type IV pilus assembly protein PilM
MLISRKNQLIGLDIGSHSIKLVEIDHTKKGSVLKNVGIAGLPPKAIVEGSIRDSQAVISAIRELWGNLRVKNRNVATSISGYSVIVKKMRMSRKAESELEATIQEEAEQYIPFDINDVYLDFDILDTSEERPSDGEPGGAQGRPEQMEVVLVATKKDIVDEYLALLGLAGLTCVILDVDAFAMQNAFEMGLKGVEPEGCFALVNVGAEELGINAVKKGASLFSRDSFYGGSQITEAIMSEFNVDFQEAERIKLGGSQVDRKKRRLEEIFTLVVSDWVREVKRALDFVTSTYPEETLEKIFVCGGSSRIPGFHDLLRQQTGLPVEDLNPFANLIINDKIFDSEYLKPLASQLAVASGLAFRSMGDK